MNAGMHRTHTRFSNKTYRFFIRIHIKEKILSKKLIGNLRIITGKLLKLLQDDLLYLFLEVKYIIFFTRVF